MNKINWNAFEGIDPSLVEEWVEDEENAGEDPGFYDDWDDTLSAVIPTTYQPGIDICPVSLLMQNLKG